MLTIRKIRVASDDWRAARRTADYVLEAKESPAMVAREIDRVAGETIVPDGGDGPSTAIWLGSSLMLEKLGVEPRADLLAQQLGRALQGRHAVTGERVRTEGMIHRYVNDEHGRPVFDEHGRRRKVRVRGTKCVDLTFSAPKSVSVAWSQARPALRAEIESAMLTAADAMLANMTLAKPVVAHGRALWPAHGFAAAAALHVLARAAKGEAQPSPQLHVHGIVVGVERDDGFFASPELSGMFKYGAPLEGGAVARAKLAEQLVDMGFEIDRDGRFFELRGVPKQLVKRMSGRTRDVEAGISAREALRGKQLTPGERAVVALETRMPKGQEASLEVTVAAWARQAAGFGFGPGAVDALRSGSGFAGSADKRRASLATAVRERIRTSKPVRSVGEARAIVLECAAGCLRLDEAGSAVDELAMPPPA